MTSYTTRVSMLVWAVFSVLFMGASSEPNTQCDEVNCFVFLDSSSQEGVQDWTLKQLSDATPVKLFELEIDVHSNSPLMYVSDCKDPEQLDASSCMAKGLSCSSMGKSYFSSVYAGPSSCSGTFITENVVLTAGHCCLEAQNAWSLDTAFFLDYDHGQYSATYLPTELIVPKPWYDSSDRRYDWCFMKMNDTAPNHLQTSWSFDPSQFSNGFSAYGWPALAPYDGSSLYQATGQCRGTSAVWPPSQYDPCDQIPDDAGMMYMTCNTMTPGCSGGPWYDPTIGIFGLNSALINAPGEPTIFVTPYFGEDFHKSCKKAGVCT